MESARRSKKRPALLGSRRRPQKDRKIVVKTETGIKHFEDGNAVMLEAALILKHEAPGIPPPPDPGRALIVVLWREAGRKGADLDYRAIEWDVHERFHSSSSGDNDTLPFKVYATATEVIVSTGEDVDAHELAKKILAMVSRRAIPSCPKGVREGTHQRFWAISCSFHSHYSPEMLHRRYCELHPDPQMGGDPISMTTVSAWLSSMTHSGHLLRSGSGPSTAYDINRRPITR